MMQVKKKQKNTTFQKGEKGERRRALFTLSADALTVSLFSEKEEKKCCVHEERYDLSKELFMQEGILLPREDERAFFARVGKALSFAFERLLQKKAKEIFSLVSIDFVFSQPFVFHEEQKITIVFSEDEEKRLPKKESLQNFLSQKIQDEIREEGKELVETHYKQLFLNGHVVEEETFFSATEGERAMVLMYSFIPSTWKEKILALLEKYLPREEIHFFSRALLFDFLLREKWEKEQYLFMDSFSYTTQLMKAHHELNVHASIPFGPLMMIRSISQRTGIPPRKIEHFFEEGFSPLFHQEQKERLQKVFEKELEILEEKLYEEFRYLSQRGGIPLPLIFSSPAFPFFEKQFAHHLENSDYLAQIFFKKRDTVFVQPFLEEIDLQDSSVQECFSVFSRREKCIFLYAIEALKQKGL